VPPILQLLTPAKHHRSGIVRVACKCNRSARAETADAQEPAAQHYALL
jgi:hypothetical protein